MADQKDFQRQSSDQLLFSNIPIDCDVEYLRLWVELRGYKVFNVKLIQDLVSGTSTSFAQVQLMNPIDIEEAEQVLDGQYLRRKAIRVRRIATFQSDTGSDPGIAA